jgi:hypothetical protein
MTTEEKITELLASFDVSDMRGLHNLILKTDDRTERMLYYALLDYVMVQKQREIIAEDKFVI